MTHSREQSLEEPRPIPGWGGGGLLGPEDVSRLRSQDRGEGQGVHSRSTKELVGVSCCVACAYPPPSQTGDPSRPEDMCPGVTSQPSRVGFSSPSLPSPFVLPSLSFSGLMDWGCPLDCRLLRIKLKP